MPIDRVALLLQDTAEFPSLSMRRYATSLADGLHATGATGWMVDMPAVHEPAALARVAGRANASRWGRLVRYPKLVRRLRRELRPDVCHVLDHSHANLLRACDPNASVATIHDLIPMLAAVGELDFKVGRLVRHTFASKLRLIAKCRRVIAVSESTKRQLMRFADIPADRVCVVHNGVSDAFAPAADEAMRVAERGAVLGLYGIDAGRRVMLHVCTPMRYKNSPALLHALAKLPGDVILLRVGSPLFDDERALAERLRLVDRIINAGTVAGEAALIAHYRAADVFAFPSIMEGFGWPPLEAMACGAPVVLSNAASLPEVGGEAALYVDPHDHAGLAAQIDRLLSNADEHADRRARGIAWARTFTWDRCARETAAVYDQVVGRN